MARPGHTGPGKGRAFVVGAMTLATLAGAVLVKAPLAAAAGPALVQSAGNSGSNATTGSSVAITATLSKSCTAGDTLVAFVTIAQQVGDAGAVAISPHGWTRLYEHSPSDHVAAYHVWFALSGCSGVSAATFTITAPGNPDGTTGSVVLSEYSGLPSSLELEYGTNAGGDGGATSGSLTSDVSAPSGTVVLTALSIYAPSSVTSTPSGWSSAGSAAGSLPASVWWQTGGGGAPSASFTWSPASSAWEMSMVILAAGPTGGPPNVVQEGSAAGSSASWSVTLPQGVAAGDALVATLMSDAARSGAGFEASAVSGGGVTWQHVTGYGTSGGGTAEIWAGFASAGTSGSTSVTATFGASTDGQMMVSEVSGIGGIDTSSTASGSNADPTAASLTPKAGDFLVAAMAAPGSVLTIHPGPIWSTYSISTTPAYEAEWQSSVPAVATSPQWTDAGSASWAAVMAAFTTASGVSGSPTVTGVNPASGTTAGGTSVTITGTNLSTVTVVRFGTTTASFTLGSATSMTATSPAGAVGTVDVSVTNPVGTSAANSSDQFTYDTPGTIVPVGSALNSNAAVGLTTLAVSPKTVGDVLVFTAHSPVSTITVSSISGGGVATWTKAVSYPNTTFGADDEIWFGKITTAGASTITVTWSASVASHTTEYSAQEFSAGLGSGTVWAADKTGTRNGTSSATVTFPSLTPSATSELYVGYAVVANTGVAGTTTGFSYALTSEDNLVTYDTNVSAAVSPTASQTPAGTATALAVILSATSSSPPPAPTVTGLSPTTGSTAGGTTVTITGTGFTGVTGVKFGTVAGTGVVVNSTTSITVTAPAGSGTVDVTVTTGAGTSATSPADQFTYTAPASPTVTGLSPTTGSTAGGTTVTITGTGFTGVTGVKFGTVAGTGVVVNSTTSITVTAPAGSGTVDVTVTTGAGTSATSPADQFTYTAPASPTVTGLSPTTGSTAGGTTVTITGTGFTGVTGVKFGTVAGTGVVVNSTTSITVTAPAGSGTVDVTVTTGAGTSATSPADQFTYTAPASPTVTGLSPTTGSTAGGTTVTITGTGFTGVTGVKFGTVAGTGVVVNSTTSITVTAPAGSGTVDVTVTTGAGTSATSPADQFTYTAPASPTVTGLSPTTGSTAGGTTVTITGTGFTGVTGVKFGTVAGTGVVVNSTTSITVTAPAGSGTVDVTVTTGAGTSATSPADHFTYTAVTTITAVGTFTTNAAVGLTTLAVSPKTVGDVLVFTAHSPVSTITVSSISGGGVATWTKAVSYPNTTFGADDEIWFGKITTAGASTITVTWSASVASHTTEYSAQEFSAGLGSGTVWAADKTGTRNGTSSATVTFPSLTPSATSELYVGYAVVANTGVAGTTTGFSYALTSEDNLVTYDTNVSAAVSPTASQTPAGTATALAVILSATSSSPPPAPTVTGLSPTTGSTAGGTTVTITGTGFTGVTGVKFGTVAGTGVVVNSTTSITVTAPAGSGTVDVTVTTGAGTSATSPADQFTYTAPASPTVTGLSPTTGSTAGGTTVTITGTGFTGVTGVKFGTVAGTGVVVNSTTSITVTAPAGSGTVDVTVTTGAGTSATSPADQFTYTAPASPTVTGLSPTTGSTAGGTTVTITGTGFTGVTGVKFGTVAGTGVVVNSTTSITVTAPAGSGTVDVTVTTGAGTSATSPADQFTYTAPASPTVTGLSPTTGSTAGGTTVTITGTGFTGVTGVKFGTVAGTGVVVNSTTSITVTAPAGSGTVDVTVTTGAGTSATSPADHFTYTAVTTITAVGTFTTNAAVGLTTLAVSPKTVGDVLVFTAHSPVSTITVSSISGGGVATWTKAVSYPNTTFGADDEIWFGKITTAGASTITVTWSASVASHTTEYSAQEFSAGLGSGTVWAADKTGTRNGTSSATVTFPSLTPSATSELYVGYAVVANTGVAGTTTGFSYALTSEDNLVTYDTNVSAAVSPTASQTPAGTATALAVILSAT